MAYNSFVNNAWRYSGLEAVSSWLYGHAPNASKSGAGHACCTSGVTNAADKVKGHCIGGAGHWHRLGGRGAGPCFVRLAGLSGALAVGFGAYGAHVFNKKPVSDELKKVYETGNQYHLIHSLALMAVPLTRRPAITGSLFVLGMMLFCGSCYFHALTENKQVRAVTPYGGMLLILGWISMVV